ncbi:MAG TPA: right-handed parallel beta-helix repeat-containing protein [Thermoguttaceae bacterium]|nr:right-handed parallel beta-helix repeat-containing protein [Thermoguttaceae bacterium]
MVRQPLLISLLAAVSVLALCLGGTASAVELYCATDGNDAWSGRLAAPNADRTDGPFATLPRARDAVRELKQAGLEEPVTVFVRSGSYRLSEPLVFTPDDSGTEACPIAYAAHPNEAPIISGGRPISGWKKPAEGNVWTAEVPEVASGGWYFHQLFVDGQRRVRARMPNEGYLINEGPIEPLVDRQKAHQDPSSKMGFRFKPGDMRRWTNLEDVNVLQFHSWTVSVHWIKELDEENHVVRFTAPANWPTGYWTKNERYYLENFPEALDAPGEWYLDRKKGVLSYWPMPGEDMTKVEVIAPVLRHLVRLEGVPEEGKPVERVSFRGLSFQHTDWLIADKGPADGQAAHFLEAAILARGARHCGFEWCEIAHVGEYALWLRAGSTDNRVFHCHLHDLAGGGVKIGETADPPSEALAAGRNVVDNCFIHDTGHMFHAAVGVWIGRSSYNTVTHNEICDLDYTGVSVGWSWGYAPSSANHNVVEYNHIHDVGRAVLGDMGGIYTLGISPGTRLCHNVIHDVYSPGIGGGAGIYPDEGSTELLIENNLVYHMERGCFSQHYGKENTVRNNIFALSRTGEVARYREEDHLSFTFERNVVYSTSGYFLIGNWGNGNYRIQGNLYCDTSTADPDFGDLGFDEWQALGRDEGSQIADPLFVDAAALDFRLKPESPALKMGFEPFDTGEVGLYGEPEWVELPKEIVRKPLDLPPVAHRGPQPIDEGFEQTPLGEPAAMATTSGEGQGGSIRVTDETAAGGKRSLKLTDAPGLEYTWQPHLYYHPQFRRGTARLTYAVRLEPGAILVNEWRDTAQPYRVGPSIQIDADGQLTANRMPLVKVPLGEWIRIEIRAPLGKEATGTYQLTVTAPGQEPKKFEGLAVGNPDWRSLRWLGFIGVADAKTAIYLDDVKLEQLP